MNDTELIVDHTITIPLRVTDFDRFEQLKPSAILSLFQEAATQQALLMNIGHDAMEERGVFWVVVRTYYELLQQPELYGTVQVRTWPHHPSRFSFLRDYTIMALDGTPLVRGTSEWVLMSIETREFVEVSSAYEAPDNLLEERQFEKKPRKVKDFDAAEMQPFSMVPPFSSVDLNGHVNNSYYADYPFDALDAAEPLSVRSFQIDYRHEVLPDEPICIYNTVQDGMLFSKGTKEDGTIMFASKAELG